MEFETTIEKSDVELYGIDYDLVKQDIEPDAVLIKWTIELETRPYGIKMGIITINSISGKYNLIKLGDDFDIKEIEFSSDSAFSLYGKKSESNPLGWDIKTILYISDDYQLYPTSIEIDFAQRIFTVNFNN